MIRSATLIAALALPTASLAEQTRLLSVSGTKEVLEGDPESASIDALGRISTGPIQSVLHKGGDHPILALLAGPDGVLWAGTGGGGLLAFGPGGAPKALVAPSSRIYAALARSASTLYAGVSPDAEIVTFEGGTQKPWAKLDAKYVWAILPEGQGVLAATGEPGRLLRIAKGGKSEVVFDPGETHVRALLAHPKRGLILGGGQKGIVYQWNGKSAYALYDSELDEVTALAADPETGDLYAAIVSETKSGEVLPEHFIGPTKGETEDEKAPFKGSEVVRIKSDGQVEVLWSSKSEGALALVFEGGRLYFGTGTGKKGRGRIYSVEKSARDRLLLHARLEPSIVSALIPAPTGGALLAGTAPSGQLVRIGPGARGESVYLTSEQDLSRISSVGRLWFDAELPTGSRVELSARSGNTKIQGSTWSDWSAPVSDPEGEGIVVPRARYLQMRAVLKAAPNGRSPILKGLYASVVRANVPPRVTEVFLLRRGVYLATMPTEEDKEKTVTLSKNLLKELRGPEVVDDQRTRARQGLRPGMLTAAVSADDPNRDDLLFAFELKKEGGEWTEVAKDLTEPYFSFDSRAHPDGRYVFRATISDRPSNSPDQTLTDRAESEPFIIDNGAPLLSGIKVAGTSKLTVEAIAQDDFSPITIAEVAIDGGPWLMLPAKDGLLDAKSEKLALTVDGLKGNKHTVLIRIEDDAGNVTTASGK